MGSIRLTLTLLVTVLLLANPLQAEPAGFFLTWKDDPCTTMIVDWHVEDGQEVPLLEYRKKGAEEWRTANGTEGKYPFAKRRLFREELAGLEAGTTYEFRFGADGEVRTFRTMPSSLQNPVKFAVGGDTRHQTEWFEKMNRLAVSHEPDFVVLGGDLAYENGEEGSVQNIIDWFDAFGKTMVTKSGRVVPVLVAIGNHEVRGGFIGSAQAKSLREENPTLSEEAVREKLAPYFYNLFACPGQPGYRAMDFGNYLSLILLDSNHTNPIDGTQRDWLEKALAARKDCPNVFPVYHVPAYPSVRPFDEPVSTLVRRHWVPLFEKFGVRLAFENHDHAFKRTKPLREGKVDPEGIVFLGDGAWGVGPRQPHADSWYLEKSAGVRNCMIVTLDGKGRSVEVFDEDGKPLDAF